ncbi:response regulator [Microbacterium sp. ARD31]|uniref:response regulator n=1 Tax=Microbacterium sp. ARD31 TaxID=2962576 RepID=UPI002882273A|nr:response regulator [Microbacterium sp. ARD31]MDT0182770.1 response regulator [Microbacterium sp. ARD31]
MANVLVVDDDQDMRDLIELVLRRSELDVVAVGSPLAALDLVGTTHFDLAVLDWSMPQMDGGELCARLREVPELRDLPILILTAYADAATRERAFEAGATDFMSKPFTLKDLRGIVATLLGPTS